MRNFWAPFILILVISAQAPAQVSGTMISTLLSEDFLFTGPNCFNSALRALGLQKDKRHLLETEMDFILSSSCTRSSRLSGQSLGILRSPVSGAPLHGFVPLEGNRVFTKNGLSKRAKNEIQSEQQMLALHTTAAQKSCSSNALGNCVPLLVEYYVCDSIPAFEIESLMGEIQDNRGWAFSSEFHDLFRRSTKELAARRISDQKVCEARKHILQSLIASWTLINYASITPAESAEVEALVAGLRALSEMSQCETPIERP